MWSIGSSPVTNLWHPSSIIQSCQHWWKSDWTLHKVFFVLQGILTAPSVTACQDQPQEKWADDEDLHSLSSPSWNFIPGLSQLTKGKKNIPWVSASPVFQDEVPMIMAMSFYVSTDDWTIIPFSYRYWHKYACIRPIYPPFVKFNVPFDSSPLFFAHLLLNIPFFMSYSFRLYFQPWWLAM